MKAIRHQDRRAPRLRNLAGTVVYALVLVLSVSLLTLAIAMIMQKTVLSG